LRILFEHSAINHVIFHLRLYSLATNDCPRVIRKRIIGSRIIKCTFYQNFFFKFHNCETYWASSSSRPQEPRGLRHGSTTVGLLGLNVRIQPGYRCVFPECCVLSGSILCDELITRPGASCRPWFVVVCDLENTGNCKRIAGW